MEGRTGLRSTIQRAFDGVRRITPGPVAAILRRSGATRLLRRFDPLNDPEYAWPLRGPLRGMVFKVRDAAEAQYVAADYEPRTCEAIRRAVRPGMVCADVGANIGYTALVLARACGPDGRVVAFEALPANVAQLRENVRINGLDGRVRVEAAAVSDGSAPLALLHEGDSGFESSLLPRPGRRGGVVVPCVALDAYFRDADRLDFVKMDVEGGETAALAGMRDVLARLRPVCLVELHRDAAPAAARELRAAGYRLADLDGRDVGEVDPTAISHVVATPGAPPSA